MSLNISGRSSRRLLECVGTMGWPRSGRPSTRRPPGPTDRRPRRSVRARSSALGRYRPAFARAPARRRSRQRLCPGRRRRPNYRTGLKLLTRFVRAGLEAQEGLLPSSAAGCGIAREVLPEAPPNPSRHLPDSAWLNNQRPTGSADRRRGRGSPSANQYETLLADRETAIALLREAWADRS